MGPGGGNGSGLGGSKEGGTGSRFRPMLPPVLGNQDSPRGGGGPDIVARRWEGGGKDGRGRSPVLRE